jgi:hypothetical protein
MDHLCVVFVCGVDAQGFYARFKVRVCLQAEPLIESYYDSLSMDHLCVVFVCGVHAQGFYAATSVQDYAKRTHS